MFQSNPQITETISKDLTSTAGASISGRSIGNITFDIVLSETHTSNLRISENPIEDGSVIADHAALEPKEITIVGVMVDYEPQASLSNAFENNILRSGSDFLNLIELPVNIKNRTSSALNSIKSTLSTFSSALSSVRAIAPWIPDFMPIQNASSLTSSSARVSQAYSDLLTSQKSGEVITINTGLRSYENMLITAIAIPQDKDGSAEFTVVLREVFIVDTEKTSGVSVTLENKSSGKSSERSGKGKSQGSTKTNKGNTQPQKKDASILSGGGRISLPGSK